MMRRIGWNRILAMVSNVIAVAFTFSSYRDMNGATFLLTFLCYTIIFLLYEVLDKLEERQ
ncbi:hypothetical protein ACFQ41_04790 [Lacticaseibacillus suilingensis]|uniref:Uncharacterized protein n=1 Tax=Lacticaseibacillus suilingensis TaxID=2799577 RepID=A0ABW4BDS8_9LACO|nr:hypothetical protein [Lacticaseibacillus suilingensis]